MPDIRCGRFQRVAERAAWSAAIAQLVEHVIRNDGVTGSNPVCGTSKIKYLAAATQSLKSGCPHYVRTGNADCGLSCDEMGTAAVYALVPNGPVVSATA